MKNNTHTILAQIKSKLISFLGALSILSVIALINGTPIQAGSPIPPSYQFIMQPATGNGDNTGDGGTGIGYALHEYYVGQTFQAQIQINTGTVNAASGDVEIRVPENYLNCTLIDGSVFESYVSQISNQAGNDIYKLTGYFNTPGKSFKGTAIFGTLQCTVTAQRENFQQTANPLPLEFYFLGENPLNSTDCNIGDATTSLDVLKSVENANIYLWPDTNPPFADTFNPTSNATNIAVMGNQPSFWFRDLNITTGDETGIVQASLTSKYRNKTTPTFTNTTHAWSNCTGTWANSNQCQGKINPPLIAFNRYFAYDADYEFCVQDGLDKASLTQTPAGPNMMTPACFSFHTEADTSVPTIINNQPTGSAATVNSSINFTIRDVKTTQTSIYGTGVNASTIAINVKATNSSNVIVDENLTCSSPGVVCTPIGPALDTAGHYYAYSVVYSPSYNFAQNSVTTVTISSSKDFVNNTMANFSWNFRIEDTSAPTIINLSPPADSTNIASGSGLIEFDVTDSGVGVDINSLIVRIKDDFYQIGGINDSRITISGDASNYHVIIDPLFDIKNTSTPFGVTINVSDLVSNHLIPEKLYALIDETDNQNCPLGCGQDGICNPNCVNDPDCPSGGNCPVVPPPTPCPTPNPSPAPNCPANPEAGPESCNKDGRCNPYCKNDPDCENGTNCDKNTCDNSCPTVTCPPELPAKIVYQRIANDEKCNQYATENLNLAELCTEASISAQTSNQQLPKIDFSGFNYNNTCRKNWCSFIPCWILWLIIIILTILYTIKIKKYNNLKKEYQDYQERAEKNKVSSK